MSVNAQEAKGVRRPDTGVIGNCEWEGMGSVNQNQILYKINMAHNHWAIFPLSLCFQWIFSHGQYQSLETR